MCCYNYLKDFKYLCSDIHYSYGLLMVKLTRNNVTAKVKQVILLTRSTTQSNLISKVNATYGFSGV